MGCSSGKAGAASPKPIALGPAAAGAPQAAPAARPAAPVQRGAATGAQVDSLSGVRVEVPAAENGAPPRGSGMVASLMQTANQVTEQVTGQSVQQIRQSMVETADSWKSKMSQQMEDALRSSDNARINTILDSAMASSALGRNAPDSVRRAADRVASRQLSEAIASKDPKQLKGALVSAKRLNATGVPEFDKAVEKYREVRRLPAGWDVNKMVLQRVGDKMVAKLDVSDPKVEAKFQRLLDLTHRKVYTRDRMGEAVPKRLKLIGVTGITNDDLWGDYMVSRETIRREVVEDPSDFYKYDVDTMRTAGTSGAAAAASGCGESAADIAASLAADFGQPMLEDVNEVFLFHGTTAAAADGIATHDFKVNLAGTGAGSLYGRGVYLAENSTKSDEYTQPNNSGDRYLLVCRVVLGRALYIDTKETDPRACESSCLRGKYHSVLGDRKKCRGTFREFVVFGEDQIYPNYIVKYQRVEDAPDVSTTFQVACPAGAPPGSTIQVKTPDGSSLLVVVPAGVSAGQTFMIQRAKEV